MAIISVFNNHSNDSYVPQVNPRDNEAVYDHTSSLHPRAPSELTSQHVPLNWNDTQALTALVPSIAALRVNAHNDMGQAPIVNSRGNLPATSSNVTAVSRVPRDTSRVARSNEPGRRGAVVIVHTRPQHRQRDRQGQGRLPQTPTPQARERQMQVSTPNDSSHSRASVTHRHARVVSTTSRNIPDTQPRSSACFRAGNSSAPLYCYGITYESSPGSAAPQTSLSLSDFPRDSKGRTIIGPGVFSGQIKGNVNTINISVHRVQSDRDRTNSSYTSKSRDR